MNRRSFFKRSAAVVGAGVAVSKLGTDDLFEIPVLHGDGKTDDTTALNAWWKGKRVLWSNGKPVPRVIRQRVFMVNTAMDAEVKSDRFVLCGFILSNDYDTRRFVRAAGKIGRS